MKYQNCFLFIFVGVAVAVCGLVHAVAAMRCVLVVCLCDVERVRRVCSIHSLQTIYLFDSARNRRRHGRHSHQ